MATRVVKPHDTRRSEILDAAQRLFYTKGYDQTSIEDILNTVGIAKGTFYHYFGSKAELLNELISRMLQDALRLIEPIVADEGLPALEKFNRCFREALAWKTENKALFLGILKTYYSDENAILRDRLKAATAQALTPVLARIIRQGVAEGVFHTDYPDDIGRVILAIGQEVSDVVALRLLQAHKVAASLSQVEHEVAIAQHAAERVLAAPPGSLQLVDLALLREWFREAKDGEDPQASLA